MLERVMSWMSIDGPPRPRRPEMSTWLYALGMELLAAGAFTGLGCAAWIALLRSGEAGGLYLTLTPAVALAALFGGQRAGLTATILCGLVIAHWTTPTDHLPQWVELGLFATAGTLITAAAGTMHRARARLAEEIATRTETEKELRVSHARLSSILENAEDAIIAFDTDQLITLFNYGAEQAFGYTAEEALGKPLDLLLPQRFRGSHLTHVTQFGAGDVAARRMGQRNRVVGLRRNGEEFPADATIVRFGDDRGTYFATILRDMTETRRIQDELERRVAERTRQLEEEMRRRQEAQEAVARSQRMEALGNLTGGIAHDLNNLLTVITGNLQLIEMAPTDERVRGFLAEAERAAEIGARLNQRLLTFSRQRQLAAVPLDLNETVIGMRELLRRALGEHIVVTAELTAGLWLARVDPTEAENALLNLAINARDAMKEGGNLTIETRNVMVREDDAGGGALQPGAYVCLSMADTGCGMTAEVAARAFEPFFTTKGQGRGTGLGLATIYGFVTQSGGQVSLWSEPGHGTKISLLLPRLDADGNQSAVAQEKAVAHGGGETVLVVEDNPAVRRVTAARLESLGYRVVEAESGRSALAVLDDGADVDLVFSDIVMPGGMSGYDLARELAQRIQTVKILLTSAYTEALAKDDSGTLNIKVLRKPYKMSSLAAAIRAALDT